VSDSKGQALGGVEVETDPSTGFAVSDTAGSYRIDGVAAGTYAVRAARSGYRTLERQGVVVSAGGQALVDLKMLPLGDRGAIAGRVLSAANGVAVANAVVATEPASVQVTSGADGSYRVEALAPGSYHLLAAAAGFADMRAGPVTVTDGTVTLDLSMAVAVVYDSTCVGCHVNPGRILADLAIDPPADAHGEQGSTGEG
jgi:hypothetical protein